MSCPNCQTARFPCACPPFSRPIRTQPALPACWPHYVIPCSHLLDPPYATPNLASPFPRMPRAFESETRAAGTGMVWRPPMQSRWGR